MISVWRSPKQVEAVGEIDYVLTPHVSLVLADDRTARLLDMGGAFFALPAIGAEMLVSTLERGSAAAARELAQRYEVDPAQVQADVASLLRQLRQRGLLRKGRQRRFDLGMGLAQLLFPCLSFIRSRFSGRTRMFLVLTLVKLALLGLGWAGTITVWQRYLGQLAPRDGAPPDEQSVRAVDQAVRQLATGHPLPMACKKRALACWTLLRWEGLPTTLVVGLEFFPLVGHCWCEAGEWVLSDYSDHCEFYTPVLSYA